MAQYATYQKSSSVTSANLIFIYCKLKVNQGDKRLLFEELRKNNKNANENPLWINDKDLLQDARETANKSELCNPLLKYSTYGEFVMTKYNMGPKHFSSLTKADQLYALTLSEYLCKYDTDELSKFNSLPADINKAHVENGLPEISDESIGLKLEEMIQGASTLWLARMRNFNPDGNCLLPDSFRKIFAD